MARRAVAERGWNSLSGFKLFCTKRCSSQGRNLALIGSIDASSLYSGPTGVVSVVTGEVRIVHRTLQGYLAHKKSPLPRTLQ